MVYLYDIIIASLVCVYSDLLQNPQIIPVKMLQGSASVGGLGECIVTVRLWRCSLHAACNSDLDLYIV